MKMLNFIRKKFINIYMQPVLKKARKYFPFMVIMLVIFAGRLFAFQDDYQDFGFEQDFLVEGKITNEHGDPLPNVKVEIIGTPNASKSDGQGHYSISVSQNGILTFSKEGYETRQLEILGRKTIDVILQKSGQGLDEIVSSSLGIKGQKGGGDPAFTEIKGEDLAQSGDENLRQILTRIVEGVNKSKAKKENENKSRVIIRGNTALSNDDQPLYVIDGNPIDSNNSGAAGMWGEKAGGVELNSVTPEDIASIRVLQGKEATKMYGSRASNGVIEIITKMGMKRRGE